MPVRYSPTKLDIWGRMYHGVICVVLAQTGNNYIIYILRTSNNNKPSTGPCGSPVLLTNWTSIH